MLPKRLRVPIEQFVGPQAPRPTQTIRGELFGVRIYRTTLPHTRIGVVIGKSVDKRAVMRNRIRRTIMDVAQQQITTVPVADYLFMVNRAAAIAPKEKLAKCVIELLNTNKLTS